MNRWGRRATCLVCRFDMSAAFTRAERVAARAEIARQMSSGICDACQRRRHVAAVEFMHAAEYLRMVVTMGGTTALNRLAAVGPPDGRRGGSRPQPAGVASDFLHAVSRVEYAEARCVELQMWPASRAGTRGAAAHLHPRTRG